ncbi:MAG: hypothetical protein AB2795_19990 [Candidatus Thiodiazotropha endolucinida]
MSNMYSLLTKLPAVPVLCSGTQHKVTPKEIETLYAINEMVVEEADTLMIGVGELSQIISEVARNDAAANQDRIVYLSCLVNIAANTVEGLRFIKSEADYILTYYERKEGAQS